MSTSIAKSKAAAKSTSKGLTDQEIQQTYSRLTSDLQTIASKIGELETEADEHELVLATLGDVVQDDPDRKCFRLVGGVLVERTVKDVVPALQTNRDGIRKVVTNLAEQYKSKEEELDALKREYNIRPVSRA